LLPGAHRGGDAVSGQLAVETKTLGVLPDQKHQLDVGQLRQDARMPGLRAFATRRQVAALGVVSRETEAHADDRYVSGVVERFLIEAEPIANANAGRIGIGSAGRMGACARRLADDADARGRLRLEDGTRVGRVRAIYDFGAGDTLELARDGASPVLVPFTRAVVPIVEPAEGRLVLDPPPGLLGDDEP